MDFWDATKVMVRRWYLTIPLLLLTFAGTAYTATAIEADYVLTSYIQLIPSQTSLTEEEARKYPVNPWNQLGLEAMSQSSNYATVDHTFLKRLESEGFSTNLKITSGDPVAGATIEVVGKTEAQAIGTTDAVIKRYQETTKQLQAKYKVRPQDMITVQRLDQGENLERPGGKVKRAIIAVFGVGILFTTAVVIGFDALLRRRKRSAEIEADTDRSGSASEGHDRLLNSSPTMPVHDHGGETVRIQLPASGARQQAPRTKSETVTTVVPVDVVSDATIVLPTPHVMNENGGQRR